MKKLAIVSTHPIQYNAPLFKQLAVRGVIAIKVFYTLPEAAGEFTDKEFDRVIKWDLPLLEGYSYTFVDNAANNPSSKSFFGVNNPTLIEEIKTWGADAILVYGWNFISHIKVLNYFKGKLPIYFRGDSTLLDERPGIKKLIRRLLLRSVYRLVDKVLYVGASNKQYYLAHGLGEENLVLAPHTVDVVRFMQWSAEQEIQKQKLKQQLDLEEATHVFLFVGKFIEKKNPLMLVEAFKRAAFDNNVHLLLVGSGKLEEQLKNAAKGKETIHFLPFQNQTHIPLTYRLGNTLVLPSAGPGETWGLVVNEALACGLSVIVSDKVGCAPDMVASHVNCHMFRYNKPEQLAELLRQVVNEPHKQPVYDQQHSGLFTIDQLCQVIENEMSTQKR